MIACGVAGLALAAPLHLGSLARMGPGFMPTALSALVVLIGLVVLLSDLRHGEEEDPSLRPVWRPFALILAAVAVFGLLIDRAGLVAAITAAILIAAPAEPGQRPLEIALLIVGLIVFTAVLFIAGLGMNIRLW